MASPTGTTSGLAYLPHWLQDTKDESALDAQLSAWGRASSCRVAGLVWPADLKPNLMIQARPDSADKLAAPPAEYLDIAKAIRNGTPTMAWQTQSGTVRLYAAIQPQGRAAGLIWLERGSSETWTDADKHYLILSAKLIERSPALLARIGRNIDSERLQQRLQDASVIAGRMAHDFDNILTGIIGFADLSLPLVPAGSQPARFLGEISKVGQRGIVFTQQLHQMSRAGQQKPLPGNIAAVVAKEELRVRSALPSGARIVTDIPASLPSVGMEAMPLGIVLGHLIENAIEASPAQGRIVVSAKIVELNTADTQGYLGQLNPGAHVEVTIRDDGPGITPEVRAKLFAEPFFTTKVRHRGLGLAIVYRALCAHGGGIRFAATAFPDTGTTVHALFPLAAARPTATLTTPRPMGASILGG
jgi:signal transduction histidine kinase